MEIERYNSAQQKIKELEEQIATLKGNSVDRTEDEKPHSDICTTEEEKTDSDISTTEKKTKKQPKKKPESVVETTSKTISITFEDMGIFF